MALVRSMDFGEVLKKIGRLVSPRCNFGGWYGDPRGLQSPRTLTVPRERLGWTLHNWSLGAMRKVRRSEGSRSLAASPIQNGTFSAPTNPWPCDVFRRSGTRLVLGISAPNKCYANPEKKTWRKARPAAAVSLYRTIELFLGPSQHRSPQQPCRNHTTNKTHKSNSPHLLLWSTVPSVLSRCLYKRGK